MPFPMRETVWAAAIRRLMAAKGWKSAAALIRDAADRGIKIRPNTLSDALNKENTTMATLQEVAGAMGVPLWALYCSEQEYAAFTAAAAQKAAETSSQERTDAIRREVLAELAPIVDAVLSKVTGVPMPAAEAEPAAKLHAVEHRKVVGGAKRK